VKVVGKPCEGEPHARFDVAGIGNGFAERRIPRLSSTLPNLRSSKLNPGTALAAHALHNSQSLLTRPVESAKASAAPPPRTCLPPGKPFGLSAGRGNAHGSRLHVI